MKSFTKWALAASLALALPSPLAIAQVTPTFNGSAPFTGQTSLNSRHQACVWLQPSGGDYGNFDADVDSSTLQAKVCVPAVTLVDSSGNAYTASSGGGGTLTVKATAAAPTFTEGSTTNQPSVDLHGSARTLLLDASGNVLDFTSPSPVYAQPSASSTYGVAQVASSAAEACHVFKASAGNAYGFSGYIGAAGWVMVFNATSAPADGAVTPVAWGYAGAAGMWSINYGLMPAYFSTGITVCASSTGPLTKTAYSTNTVFSGRVQ